MGEGFLFPTEAISKAKKGLFINHCLYYYYQAREEAATKKSLNTTDIREKINLIYEIQKLFSKDKKRQKMSIKYTRGSQLRFLLKTYFTKNTDEKVKNEILKRRDFKRLTKT